MSSPVTLRWANALIKSGNFRSALDAFRQLSIANGKNDYAANITYCRNRLPEGVKQKPSLLFVSAGLKGPTPGGGIATCFEGMMRLLKDRDVTVTVLYTAHPYYSKGNYEYWKEKFREELNVELLVLTINDKDYGSKEMKRSNAIKEFALELESCFDKIIFHDYMGLGFYTALAKKHGLGFRDTEIIVSAHGNHKLSYHFGSKKVSSWSESAILYMEKMAMQMADKVTTPSQYYADWLKRELGVKGARHMENIIQLDSLPEKSSIQLSLPSENPTIYFYGRAERLKGIDVILPALKKLKDKGVAFNFNIVGNKTKIDGKSSEDYVKTALKGTGINPYFTYNVSPGDFFAFVRENRGVVVFPTLGETSSCVVVEAIQAGVPFVASAIPGIKELVAEQDHDKALFGPGNVDDLVAHLEDLEGLSKQKISLSFDMEKNKSSWAYFLTYINKPTEDEFDEFKPSVTVVVPTCDRPELLRDSLLSLQAQTYSNMDILVFDDFSALREDNEKICLELGVKYFCSDKKVYKGLACNQAVAQTKSDYVCFFDDDDLAKPDMVARYIEAFKRDRSIDICSGFADVFEHSELQDNTNPPVQYTSYAIGNDFATNILANFFGKGTFIIRRGAFDDVGGYEVDELPVPMVDYRFYIKASLAGLNISTIPDGVYYYRKNSPKSLFYENKDNKRLQYLAKSGIEKVICDKLGDHIGHGFAHMIWNVSLPSYNS